MYGLSGRALTVDYVYSAFLIYLWYTLDDLQVTPGADHDIVTEDLAYPRIMGELTLLPDGRVFLCNGGEIGMPISFCLAALEDG